MSRKPISRILVAMSGGIDSSVAALLLKEASYNIVGVTMKTWDYASTSSSGKETGCCNLDSFNDARMIAVNNHFPHYVLDLREDFGEAVIDNFVEEYLAGRTPNPCIMCNTHIKWRALFRKAEQLGCSHIATGHYAHIGEQDGRFFIETAKDTTKDQSYVLWGLSQEVLSQTLFPISAYTKSEIREMLSRRGYDSLAKKKESYEICFIPENDYRAFLQKKDPQLSQKAGSGHYVNARGDIIGTHQGYPFYTIGQRKGLGKTFGKPTYVTDINAETNTITLGDEQELLTNHATVGKLNWQKIPAMPKRAMDSFVKIRYRDEGTWASIAPCEGSGALSVKFKTPVKAIMPGQSAVFYDEWGHVLGGGIFLKD